jgi:hypothetical protein
MKKILLFLISLLPLTLFCQNTNIGDFVRDESVFYAQTKQVNQFFRRFNGEEDIKGKRNYNGDSTYRDLKARTKFLNMLFDISGSGISSGDKNAFITQVINKKNPVFLDFHGRDWFAEVSATFTYKKEKVNLIIYMKLERQDPGYKWVFSNVYFSRFDQYFSHAGDTSNHSIFLHPLSHEIDFMNFHKIFREPENMDYYLEDHYKPDHLALFMMEVKNGNLKFEEVSDVKFHFFQVPGWYFEVHYFNRNDMNSGWLISNLIKISENDKKQLIRNYTHDN